MKIKGLRHKGIFIMQGIPVLACIMVILLYPGISHTARNPKSEYKKIQKEIKRKKSALFKTKKKETSVLEEITVINRDLERLKKDILKQRRKVRRTERQINSLKRGIVKATKKIRKQKIWLKRRIMAIQKYRYPSAGIDPSPAILGSLVTLVTADDIPQAVRRWYYLKRLASYEYALLSEYSKNLSELKKKESRYSLLLKRLNNERKQLISREHALKSKKKQKRILLASIRKKEQLYNKMISELRESSKRLARIIRESEKKRYLKKGFSKRKKKLEWPVEGILALPYGSYRDPKFKTPIYRNGIHIKSSEGATVKAVHPGKVVFADWFRGYGKVVIISHGEGYHTVYANLSEIFFNRGDIIKGGAVIGRVGDSGTLDAPGLYFEIRRKGKPLNPIHWLKTKKRTKRILKK
jgi:septal ring factor EnvC (AmiA/AmiB activator)